MPDDVLEVQEEEPTPEIEEDVVETPSDWEIEVDSATTEPQLNINLGAPINRSSSFYLEDPEMTILVVGLSLEPTTSDNMFIMQEIRVTDGESGQLWIELTNTQPVELDISAN